MRKLTAIILALMFGLLYSGPGLAVVAPDPLRIAAGGRSLGLGRAYVGLTGDINSIYTNPAGIASASHWQMTSMSAKLLNEYNYLNFGGLYPTENAGNIGVGIVRVTAGGALPTKIAEGSDPSDLIYERDPTLEAISYYDVVMLLSYGDKLGRLLGLPYLQGIAARYPWLGEVNYGGNFKIMNVGMSGGGLADASGVGMEMDLGVQSKTAYPWLEVGASAHNFLPAALGGKLTFPSGWEETYPIVLKLGLNAKILGKENALRHFGEQELALLLDTAIEPTRPPVPTLWKLGLEWRPVEVLAVRTGIEQAMAGNEVANDFTAGVGIYLSGFRFDYAFHQFKGAPGIDNHFFSLSYGIFPAPKVIDYITITEPSNQRVITTSSEVRVAGTMHPDVGSARIGAKWIKITKDGSFEVSAPVEVGKNSLWVQAFGRKGQLLESEPVRALRLITYPDVPPDYWAYDQVNHIGTLKIVQGYPDGEFKPDGDITRAELATLLVRTAAGSAEVPQATVLLFKDVEFKHWAINYVTYAADKGIVRGYPGRIFRPSGNVTRAEGLAMIARFGGVSEEAFIPIFSDMFEDHWASGIVTGAYQRGLLEHFRRKPFRPSQKLTRAEAVEIMSRTRPVQVLVDELRSFETGYETVPPAASAMDVYKI